MTGRTCTRCRRACARSPPGSRSTERLITLDTRVGDALPGMVLGPGVDEVTMRHLLSMTSGIDFRWFGHEPILWPDLAAEMLSRPSAGRRFQYSDASTYVAMRVLGAIVGDVRDWLMPRLFDPLQIDNPQWHRCPLGWIIGGTGLKLRAGASSPGSATCCSIGAGGRATVFGEPGMGRCDARHLGRHWEPAADGPLGSRHLGRTRRYVALRRTLRTVRGRARRRRRHGSPPTRKPRRTAIAALAVAVLTGSPDHAA